MARTNYQQIRRNKETARKTRQQSKLDRRVRKDSVDPSTLGGDSPSAPPPTRPNDHANK
jgi:hypothetical protein